MTKISVPEGMLKAGLLGARLEAYCGDDQRDFQHALEAALLWLSENPIVPSDAQLEDLRESVKDRTSWKGQCMEAIVEFQRRMFAAPEPEVPEEVAEMLLDETIPEADFSRPTRNYHNNQIIKAFRVGQRNPNAP